MRAFILFAHPVETSFGAALHRVIIETLSAAGHEVDDCDLYAENFNPVLSREERINYHDAAVCRKPVQGYVDRLLAAEALVLNFPVWNFGYPAILKGFFDRVFLPGVSFELTAAGGIAPKLQRIRKVAAVATYGGTRLRAMLAGDPPRKAVTRVLRAPLGLRTPITYLACYDMNRATPQSCAAFLDRVKAAMAAF